MYGEYPNGRPPFPSPRSKSKCAPGCTHKYEILEYPGVRSNKYLFYCIFCLGIEEREYKAKEGLN